MAGLEVRGAEVRFDERPVLDGLSLTVAQGEIVAVLGPSGCGKSTLLRSIVGLQPLSSGEVWLNGKDLTASPTERRGIGFLFQNPVLYPTRDVAGNLRLGLPLNVPKHERAARIAEALKEVGLEGFEQRTVDGLSGGEGQRVALARALLAEPKALLLDEPFSALDGSLRQRLVDTVRSVLKARNLPAVHVTHDADEAKAIADRCLHMEDGRLREEGA
ncbi:MAG: ABC transporter ATP-binding protein [Candidatus Poseidoniaceae archaeon]|nr:ABC transporter ATP-binding protein [Candidatus Poseidoniaceae archaeon]